MKRHIYNEQLFLNNDAISYYLLGCYLTDGSMYLNSFEITSKDKDWLELIMAKICSDTSLTPQKGCWRLRGTNKVIANWLRSNNCVPNKSLTVEFPAVPEQYFPDLIRGLIDGDGSISVNRNTIYLCSASKTFIEAFMQILDKKQIKYHSYERKETQTIIRGKICQRQNQLYKVSIWGKSCYKFLKWIYYSNSVLCMPRKHILAKTIIDIFETRGLTLDNVETFNTDQNKNSNKLKINNQDLLSLLEKWRAIPEQTRNKKGSKIQFYQENVAGKYQLNYHYFNRLLNGNQRTNITC